MVTRHPTAPGEDGLSEPHGTQKPSHIDHALISLEATVASVTTSTAYTPGRTDHVALTVDISLAETLGIRQDGRPLEAAEPRYTSAVKYSCDKTRLRFSAYAETRFLKFGERITQALDGISRTDDEIEKARAEAEHTATWSRDRWCRPPERNRRLCAQNISQNHTEPDSARDLREHLSSLADELDAFARATDLAYRRAGNAPKTNRGRRSGLRMGRGSSPQALHMHQVWCNVVNAMWALNRNDVAAAERTPSLEHFVLQSMHRGGRTAGTADATVPAPLHHRAKWRQEEALRASSLSCLESPERHSGTKM